MCLTYRDYFSAESDTKLKDAQGNYKKAEKQSKKQSIIGQ